MVNNLTGNFLIDTGKQKQFASPVSGYKSIVPDNNTKIESIATQPEEPTNTMTQEEFFDIVDNAVSSGDFQGQSDEQVYNGMLESVTQGGIIVDGIDQPTFEEEIIEEDKTILQKIEEPISNIAGGAVSTAPSQVGNTLGFLTHTLNLQNFTPLGFITSQADNKLEEAGLPTLGNIFRDSGVNQQEDLQDLLGVDKEATTTAAGELIGEIATTLTPTPAGKTALIEKLGSKYPKIAKLLESSVQGAADVAKFEVVADGTPEEVVEGAGIGAIAGPLISGIAGGTKGVINKFGGARTTEEVAGNILQPTGKAGSLNFDGAKEGLSKIVNELPKKELKTISDYKTLLTKIKDSQKETFTPLVNKLDDITKIFKDDSVQDALDGLMSVVSTQPGKKFKTLTNEVEVLLNKHLDDGLTLSEIQNVKKLHTQNNRLFTDTGKEAGGVSSEALREVRKDIKKLIEEKASTEGFKDVARINNEYSNLLDAQNLVETQLGRLTNYLGREGKQSFLQNVVDFATDLPGVKQAVTQPLQTLVGKVGRGLRAGKINPIEVEAQLPNLLKELRAANVPEGAIGEIMLNITNTLRVLTEIVSEKTIKSLLDN